MCLMTANWTFIFWKEQVDHKWIEEKLTDHLRKSTKLTKSLMALSSNYNHMKHGTPDPWRWNQITSVLQKWMKAGSSWLGYNFPQSKQNNVAATNSLNRCLEESARNFLPSKALYPAKLEDEKIFSFS